MIMNFFLLFSKKLFFISQTEVNWTDDLSNISLSLFHPFDHNNNKLEISKNVKFTVDQLYIL